LFVVGADARELGRTPGRRLRRRGGPPRHGWRHIPLWSGKPSRPRKHWVL